MIPFFHNLSNKILYLLNLLFLKYKKTTPLTIFSFYHNLVYCIQDCEREGTWTIDKKRKLVSGKLLFRSQERTKNIIYINDINHYSYFVLDKKVSTLLLKESFSQIHWFLTKTHSSINVRNWLYQNTYIYYEAKL